MRREVRAVQRAIRNGDDRTAARGHLLRVTEQRLRIAAAALLLARREHQLVERRVVDVEVPLPLRPIQLVDDVGERFAPDVLGKSHEPHGDVTHAGRRAHEEPDGRARADQERDASLVEDRSPIPPIERRKAAGLGPRVGPRLEPQQQYQREQPRP